MARILVIECDADIRTMLILFLQREGHIVRGASNGAHGLELIYEMKPDLIITEYYLPILNGFGLLRCIRQRPETYAIPVIVTTTQATEVAQPLITQAGFNAIFYKPFDLRELLECMRRLLYQSVAIAQPDPYTC